MAWHRRASMRNQPDRPGLVLAYTYRSPSLNVLGSSPIAGCGQPSPVAGVVAAALEAAYGSAHPCAYFAPATPAETGPLTERLSQLRLLIPQGYSRRFIESRSVFTRRRRGTGFRGRPLRELGSPRQKAFTPPARTPYYAECVYASWRVAAALA